MELKLGFSWIGTAPYHEGFGAVSSPFYVLYLRDGTSGWKLCKALERRGFSRIAHTRDGLRILAISATAERRYMASTAIPTEGALLELEAGKIKDVPTRKKEGGGYSAENITVLEGLAAVRLRPALYIGSTRGGG